MTRLVQHLLVHFLPRALIYQAERTALTGLFFSCSSFKSHESFSTLEKTPAAIWTEADS